MPAFDYTTFARGFALRYPVFTQISIQVNYWVFVYILLVTVIHFANRSLLVALDVEVRPPYMPAFWSGVIMGVIYGSALGIVDWRLDKRGVTKWSLGLVILIRSLIYFMVLMAVFAFLRFVIWEGVIMIHFFDPSYVIFGDDSWRFLFYITAIYSFMLAPGIGFINQMNRKFGPGIIIPMLMGKFKKPKEQQRLFMFLDMKSSTSHAERLGHLKYSSLVQDCFLDINEVLVRYRAEIYQYVGDEVVINWLDTNGFNPHITIEFFFSCQHQFEKRREYYLDTYGLVPEFKAGAHYGMVVAAEVGDIKREIAYHGDTLNTAARIQGLCNQHQSKLIISNSVKQLLSDDHSYKIDSIGELPLRGKDHPIALFRVSE